MGWLFLAFVVIAVVTAIRDDQEAHGPRERKTLAQEEPILSICKCGHEWEAIYDEATYCPVCKWPCFFDAPRVEDGGKDSTTAREGILSMLPAYSPPSLQDDGQYPQSDKV